MKSTICKALLAMVKAEQEPRTCTEVLRMIEESLGVDETSHLKNSTLLDVLRETTIGDLIEFLEAVEAIRQ